MNKNMGSGPGGQRPIEGWRQYEKDKPIEEAPPEDEFKKIMEIESATEAPQKRKRREDEGAEEIEGLNVPEKTLESPLDKEPSPLEIQAPKSLKQATYSGQKHAEMTFLPEDEAAVEPASFTEELPEAQPPTPAPTVRPPPTPQATTPTAPQEQPTPQVQEPQKPQPQEESQQQNQQQPQQQPAEQTQKPALPQEQKPAQAVPLPEQQKPKQPEPKKTPPKAAVKTEEIAAAPPEEVPKIQKEKHQEHAAEKVAESGAIAPTAAPGTPTPAAPAAEVTPASYVNLPPAIFELFDRMVSYITIKHAQGVETATVHIDMKGSIFHGSTLTLKRNLQTAPNRFDVDLHTSPEGMHLFNSNIDDLIAAFRHGKHNFDVNIKPASLAKEYRAKTRRVERKEDTEKGA